MLHILLGHANTLDVEPFLTIRGFTHDHVAVRVIWGAALTVELIGVRIVHLLVILAILLGGLTRSRGVFGFGFAAVFFLLGRPF